jgi:hypothetical protein
MSSPFLTAANDPDLRRIADLEQHLAAAREEIAALRTTNAELRAEWNHWVFDAGKYLGERDRARAKCAFLLACLDTLGDSPTQRYVLVELAQWEAALGTHVEEVTP